MTENVSFYRDSLKSYMVIRCPEGITGEGYQYRMLAANHIEGLLDCSFRNIDADSYLYYDITSRQRLSDLFTSRKISAADMRHILLDTLNVRQNLADFLLDSSRILMDPDFIFCDFHAGSCAFTYYPESTGKGGVLPLLEFMESHIDEQDNEASSTLYRLLSMAENDGFFLDREMLDRLLGPDNKQESGDGRESKFTYEQTEEEQVFSYSDYSSIAEGNGGENETDIYKPQSGEKDKEENNDRDRKKECKKRILFSAAGITCIAAGIVLYGIWDLYPEWIGNVEADTLCRAGMFLMPAIGIIILAVGKLRRKKDSVSGAQREKRDADENEEQACIYTSEYPEAFQIRDERTIKNRRETKGPEYESDFEQTVVLSPENSMQRQLYGTGKALGMRIELDNLPCTIGKMREYAGVVLNDSSVSRIHAALSAGEGGEIYIRDLNSTNGTAVNGVGLRPDESVPIRPGDVIRIGALSFVYR